MSSARLHKCARLLMAVEFKRVFDRPIKISDSYFTVLAREQDPGKRTTSQARLGLAISKRNARHAVTRNRIKRLVRESFRLARLDTGIDCVVMVTAAGARADNHTLSGSLNRHWHNLRRRCEQS